jgi:S-layer protein
VTKDAASVTTATGSIDATVTAAKAAQTGSTTGGQTFTLTKGLDNLVGTSGNDTFVAAVSTNADTNTLSTVDVLDGGTGVDTLKIVSDKDTSAAKDTIKAPTMKGIDYVEVISADKLGVDMSANAELSLVKVTKAVGSADIKAAGTTDISAYLDATTSEAVTVKGGNSVYVELSKAAAATDTVTIGSVDKDANVSDAAKGDVKVSVTGTAYSADVAQVDLGTISVNGGNTITVTQTAASDASAVAADLSAGKVVQGAVAINVNAATTTVTVKQDAAVAAKSAKYTTGGVTETASVKFSALKKGDTLEANGLKLEAKADMTAEQVASAFANLVTGKLLKDVGDTQGSAVAKNGVYTGISTAAWTSAAASGDTVVFTSATANKDVANLTFTLVKAAGSTAVEPVVTTTQGKEHNATATGGVMGVEAGKVTIGGATATALKTVTVDGYSAADSGITATSAALETLNLSNGGNFAVAAAAETFNLNLKNVGTAAKLETLTTDAVKEARAALDLNNAATKTLNVKSDGTNTVTLDLADATGTTALNVSGTGLLDAKTDSKLGNVATIKVTEAAGLNLGSTDTAKVTSVDATGTTGAVTIAIDAGKTTFAGGAGADKVTITAVTGTFKAINLGAGNDTLDLSALTADALKAIPATTTDVLNGNEGTDTIVLTTAAAAEVSKDGVFAGKIHGFDKLSLTKAAAAAAVDMSNMDGISYVISANSDTVATAAVGETQTLKLAGGVAADAADGSKITVAGVEVSVTKGMSTNALGVAIADALTAAAKAGALEYKDTVSYDTATSTITIKFTNAGNPAAATLVAAAGLLVGETPAVFTETTPYQGAGTPGAALTLNKLANGGTLELTAAGAGAIVNVADAAKGTADVLNVVLNAADTKDATLGTVKAADVETINLSVANKETTFTTVGTVKVANVSTSSLALDANAATVVNVTGAGNLKLDVTAATKVATVDASTATGALTLDLSKHEGVAVTVKGGAGNDVLKASTGTKAMADVLVGGAGADTLVAGSNGAKLTGGEGNDLFVLQAASKESNTYSSIVDFKLGDLLQLNETAGTAVKAFGALTATLNETTSVFANFVDAAIAQAAAGEAVVFNFKGNAYVVIDQGDNSATFTNGTDSVVELVGVDAANLSYNATYGTIALV